MEIRKMYLIIASMITVLSIAAFCALFFHGGYGEKILIKLGFKEPQKETNWALFSWDSCLEKLNYDADIAFIGDSITRGSNFQERFPDKKIINLGYSGDTIAGVSERLSMLKHTSPEKIFVMVGINGLTDKSSDACLKTYAKLLASMKEELPGAEVYVQSILPLSKEKSEQLSCSNDTIQNFNMELKKLAEQHQMTYVDLFSVFIENDEMKPSLSADGLHINSDGYEAWENAIASYMD